MPRAMDIYREDANDAQGWFAVWTRSRQEKAAAIALGKLDIVNYLPLRNEVRQWSDRKQNVEFPLFPGYLFVRIGQSYEQQVRVLRVPGIVRFISNLKGPERIPEAEIDAVRKVLSCDIECVTFPTLHAGDRVRVVRGILAGIEGTLVYGSAGNKLVLSVGSIQQSIAINVQSSDVEVLPLSYGKSFSIQLPHHNSIAETRSLG
jgi:transcriptional antiterminator NusG